MGRVRSASERLRGRPHRRRPAAPVEGGRVPLQRRRSTSRRYIAAFKGGFAPGQHELPVRARGDRLPVRQRRRRGRRVPRHVHRRCSRASAVGCRRCAVGTSSPTRPALAPSGRCRTSRSWRRAPTASVAPWGRSGDDLLLLYTGGTTGMPKGVMWRQDDLFNVLGAGGNATARHRAGHVGRRGW